MNTLVPSVEATRYCDRIAAELNQRMPYRFFDTSQHSLEVALETGVASCFARTVFLGARAALDGIATYIARTNRPDDDPTVKPHHAFGLIAVDSERFWGVGIDSKHDKTVQGADAAFVTFYPRSPKLRDRDLRLLSADIPDPVINAHSQYGTPLQIRPFTTGIIEYQEAAGCSQILTAEEAMAMVDALLH